MREILFKAKRISNSEWVQGNLIADEQNESNVFIGYVSGTNPDETIDGVDLAMVDPLTICQYIGLTDKNGQKIWENDVVQYCDCTVENYVIAWEADKACFEYQQYGCSIMNFDELSGIEVEVIGNIFDNPELMNE